MRLTREELLDMYPLWNESRHDIVKVFYGDIPLVIYNEKQYELFKTLTGTLANIEAIDAYIYTQNGNYNKYSTLIGDVYITENEIVLSGNIKIKYRGLIHDIFLNKMYGKYCLSILRNTSEGTKGFTNKDGLLSPSIKSRTKELDDETIEKILNNPLEDYGETIQKFMEAAREMYIQDSTNHIMEKCFNM